MNYRLVRYVGGTLGALLLSLLLLTGCGQAPAVPEADEGDEAMVEEEAADDTMDEEATDEEATEPATDEEAAEVSGDEIRVPEGDIEEFWNGFDWADLTAAEQGAWAVLGWDEESWAEETDPPASEEATWDELTEEEQEAAESLGYDQENWDATAPEE